MKNLLKNAFAFLLLVAFVSVMSSCNRGYGCPNNFKIDTAVKVVNTVSSASLPR